MRTVADKKQKEETLKRELARKAALFKKVFSTDEGKEVLKHIEKYAEPDQLFSSDPMMLAHNAARRDFYHFIRTLMEFRHEI